MTFESVRVNPIAWSENCCDEWLVGAGLDDVAARGRESADP